MASNHHDDSKSSSTEESDRSEQANEDMGTGRSYECVFCKRGFTTAQALGGHMNIHRKDRAKTRPSSLPSFPSKVDENFASFRCHPPSQSYPPPHYSSVPEVYPNYQTYYPAAAEWGLRPPHTHPSDYLYESNSQILYPFTEDWRMSLSLQVGPSRIADDKDKRQDASDQEELDLELRLGHDP